MTSSSYPSAGTTAAGKTISMDAYEIDDIEGVLLDVYEDIQTIYDALNARLEELEEMQSKHLDTFCEEIVVILEQLEEIKSAVNYTVINNSKINDWLEENDKQIRLKIIEGIGRSI